MNVLCNLYHAIYIIINFQFCLNYTSCFVYKVLKNFLTEMIENEKKK